MALKIRNKEMIYKVPVEHESEVEVEKDGETVIETVKDVTYFHIRPMDYVERQKLIGMFTKLLVSLKDDKEPVEEIDTPAIKLDRMQKCVVGWDKLEDLDGNDLPYSPEVVEQIFLYDHELADKIMEQVEKLEVKHDEKIETISKN